MVVEILEARPDEIWQVRVKVKIKMRRIEYNFSDYSPEQSAVLFLSASRYRAVSLSHFDAQCHFQY